jgi:xanthine dehydrogenase/oxidase
VVLDDIDPEITLLEYLRGIGLTGTKLYVLSKPGT